MRYFGIPTCPYCKKRVNLIRTWSLKRQGEYQCPRCGGISNIFLSPLIHVFAVLAVFSAGAMYFFHKFVLDDISLTTVLQLLIPFAAFFLLSLFMVYLVKPVIKKVSKAEMNKKNRGRNNFETRRSSAANTAGQMFYDSDEYLPQVDYQTGPMPLPEDDRDMKVLPDQPRRIAYEDEMQKTSVVELPSSSQRLAPAPTPRKTADPARPQTRSSASAPAKTRQAPDQPVSRQQPIRPQTSAQSSVSRPVGTVQEQSVQARQAAQPSAAARQRAVSSTDSPARRVVTSVDIPSVSDDFFAKYDDPNYVERRLKELKEQRGGED